MLTFDTSGVAALLDRKDRNHHACLEVLRRDAGPYIVPAGVLAEIAWYLEDRFPPQVARTFLDDLRNGAYIMHWDPGDLKRIQQLIDRYEDLPLGFSNAAVITCAERHGGRVLTTDRRHFKVVARGEGTITPLPE